MLVHATSPRHGIAAFAYTISSIDAAFFRNVKIAIMIHVPEVQTAVKGILLVIIHTIVSEGIVVGVLQADTESQVTLHQVIENAFVLDLLGRMPLKLFAHIIVYYDIIVG